MYVCIFTSYSIKNHFIKPYAAGIFKEIILKEKNQRLRESENKLRKKKKILKQKSLRSFSLLKLFVTASSQEFGSELQWFAIKIPIACMPRVYSFMTLNAKEILVQLDQYNSKNKELLELYVFYIRNMSIQNLRLKLRNIYKT